MPEGRILVPNEDGVLVVQNGAGALSSGPVSETERILSLAANSGGSGEGMSHYSQASRCGRRARLSAERYKHFAEQGSELPPTKNHFIIGSVFHKLHELARKPSGVTLDYNEQWSNPNVAEGVRLYKGWLRHWSLDFWGKCEGVEVQLSDSETFGVNVTGMLDMVVYMDDEACARASRRGLELAPGRRIIDWKTSDSPSDGSNYREGIQALWYPYLWNLHHPYNQVDGIIFDVTNKRARRKDRSVLREDFQAYYVPCGLDSVQTLAGMVRQGHRNITEDIPNRSECTNWLGDVCPFRANGACDAL